jgi:hypothetical protein
MRYRVEGPKKTTTAFALAGLGGFNAHGAGFLAAASDCGVVPNLVTATSGQIVVLADWLQGDNLEKLLIDPELEHNALAQLAVTLSGDPGVFRPAYLEAIKRWWTPPWGNSLAEGLFNRLFPAQLYVPTRKPADFTTIARVFNDEAKVDGHKIGIVFNAYNLDTGEAVLYGNDEARKLWPLQKSIPPATSDADGSDNQPSSAEPPLQPITAEAVESALWLSLYGFDQLPQPHLIDGAYHRACLVSELHTFDVIFVARPLAQGWPGDGPRNWFEVQDWQTEMWFSAGYKAEIDTLRQINKLVKAGRLDATYKLVDLVEIVPKTPAGFFHFFIERKTVYKLAYDEAVAKFASRGFSHQARISSGHRGSQ